MHSSVPTLPTGLPTTKGGEHVDRNEMPVQSRRWRWYDKPRLVAEAAEPEDPAPALLAIRSYGRWFRLRQGVQQSRSGRREEGSACGDDRFAGMVAGGLWAPR